MFSSCDSSNDAIAIGDYKTGILAKWSVYSFEDSDGVSPCEEFPNCKIMEFKSNGTLLFTEWNDYNVMKYTIDDDVLHVSWQDNRPFHSYKILHIDNENLKLDLLDGRINNLKKIN